MPYQEGIKAIQKTLAIHRALADIPYNRYTLELLRVVLENNYLDFTDRHNQPNWWACHGP